MEIAVLIPCYNEELTVEKVVRDFKKELPNASIYVYDNNSTDRTAELAKKAGAIVRYESLQGKGNVVRSMFQEIEADAYVMIDGDDTYPAEEVHKLLQPVLEGKADMVIGDRLSNGTYYKENKRLFHETGNNMVRNLINSLFHGNVNDIMTGYRVFSRRYVKCMPVMSDGFQIETEMTVYSMITKMHIVEMPIQYRDRPEGSFSKLNTYKDGWKVLVTLFDLYKNYRPMYFFFMIFVVIFVIGLCNLIPGLNLVMASNMQGMGGVVSGSLLVMTSIVFLVTGFILDLNKNQTLLELEIALNQYALNNKKEGKI